MGKILRLMRYCAKDKLPRRHLTDIKELSRNSYCRNYWTYWSKGETCPAPERKIGKNNEDKVWFVSMSTYAQSIVIIIGTKSSVVILQR